MAAPVKESSTLDLPSALDPGHADRWRRVVRGGIVFLDYDGTLTPIVERPELATLPAAMRRTLRRLAAALPVAIVSGRDAGVVADLVGLDELTYVGSHGLDIAGAPGSGLRKEVAAWCIPALDAAERRLRRETVAVAGAFVERKRFSVSTHVRRAAPADHARVEAIVEQVRRAHPSLRREGGKMLFELRPDVDWDKGAAACWLIEALGRDRSSALFIGDDLTDESVFRALAGSGTGVVVAEADRPTAADLRLRNPDEVRRLLEQVCLTKGGGGVG